MSDLFNRILSLTSIGLSIIAIFISVLPFFGIVNQDIIVSRDQNNGPVTLKLIVRNMGNKTIYFENVSLRRFKFVESGVFNDIAPDIRSDDLALVGGQALTVVYQFKGIKEFKDFFSDGGSYKFIATSQTGNDYEYELDENLVKKIASKLESERQDIKYFYVVY
jgi:hypothetical protein